MLGLLLIPFSLACDGCLSHDGLGTADGSPSGSAVGSRCTMASEQQGPIAAVARLHAMGFEGGRSSARPRVTTV